MRRDMALYLASGLTIVVQLGMIWGVSALTGIDRGDMYGVFALCTASIALIRVLAVTGRVDALSRHATDRVVVRRAARLFERRHRDGGRL